MPVTHPVPGPSGTSGHPGAPGARAPRPDDGPRDGDAPADTGTPADGGSPAGGGPRGDVPADAGTPRGGARPGRPWPDDGTGPGDGARPGGDPLSRAGTPADGGARPVGDPPTHAGTPPAGGPLPWASDDGLPWTRNDALVTVGAAAVDLIGFTLTSHTGQGEVPPVGYVLLVLSALPLLVRRRAPVSVLASVLALSLVLNLSASLGQHFNATVVVALYTAVRHRRPAVAAPAVLVSMATLLVAQTPGPTLVDVVGNISSGVLVAGAATVMNHWQRDIDANRRLLADRAVAAERRRIARELHDIVAHHITTMQLMAGGARANLDRDPEVAREALVTLEGSGRMALGEMRQLLDVLRAGDDTADAPTAPQPGVADLDRIVAESCRAGLPTTLEVRGGNRPLPPGVALTVFRVAQEALTNARRHAGPARARVRLTYRPDGVTVEVVDDGAGTTGTGSPGYGLIGMRERVALLGGTLEAGPRYEGGFRVTARLPLADEEVTPR
ncbi:histidine kinase [Streptomyces pactum]|uniref:histidine kinase n=1 Tax=Streptomyces pactum TaxID=68249 RepID=A0ABS0NLL6_9ACTN|nr:sensor histidine kinase [Streptomyces pactum]MBH5336083.1 histidine kinase [Streptomyces pactum]